MEGAAEVSELLKYLTHEVRLKILAVLAERGSCQFSELASLVNVKSSSKLSFHLSKLREIGLISVGRGGLYYITPRGKRVLSKVVEMQLSLRRGRFGKLVINEKGCPLGYVDDYLRNVLGLDPDRVPSDVALRVELYLASSREEHVRRAHLLALLAASWLCAGGLKLEDDVHVVPLKLAERVLTGNISSYRSVAWKVLTELLDEYVVGYLIPPKIRSLLYNGYLTILAPRTIYSGGTVLAVKASSLLPTRGKGLDVALGLCRTLEELHAFVAEVLLYEFESLITALASAGENEVRKAINLLVDAVSRISAEGCQVTFYLGNGIKELTPEQCEVLKRLVAVLGKSQIPAAVLFVNARKADEQVLAFLAEAHHSGVQVVFTLDDAQPAWLISSHAIRLPPPQEGPVLVKLAAAVNLPIVYARAIKQRYDIVEFLRGIAQSLSSMEAYEREPPILEVLRKRVRKGVKVVKSLSLVGFEMALRLHHGELDKNRLLGLTARIWRELRDMLGDERLVISGALAAHEPYLQINVFSGLLKEAARRGLPPRIEDFNVLSPFSNARERSLEERAELEGAFHRVIPKGSLLSIKAEGAITASSLLSLRSLLSAYNVEAFELAVDISKCSRCGTTYIGHEYICPSCLSHNMTLLIRPLVRLEEVSRVPEAVKREYGRRASYRC